MFKLATSGETFPVTSPFTTGFTGLDNDQLALDLQFATDKTLTARKGPTPVFTRASTGRFVGSNGLIQSAAINAPRFDHDPVTGICKGLLMEESRTNLILQSENLATTWGGSGRTISSDFATSPDGLTTADKLVENTANTLHGVTQTPTTVSGSTYIGSAYIKAAGRNFAMIYTGAGTANGRYVSIPADGTGAVLGLYSANPSTVTLQYVGNGWYRVSILIVSSGTGSSFEIYSSINGTSASYTGDGSSGILVWGAQLELGAFPTSYIPTTTASVVRSADVCSITGSAFSGMWNTSEGSLFVSGTGRNYAIMASGATNANQIAFLRNPSPKYMRWDVANNGNYTAQIIGQTITDETFVKSAGSYASSDARAAFNGTLGIQDLTVTIPSLIALNIGSGSSGGQQFNGTIGAVRYFRKPLSNSKLQAITI